MGGGRSAEVATASDGLDAGVIRRTRRLVRKGQTAPDCAEARLAVALARQRQRATSPGALLVFAPIPAASAWLAVERLQGHSLSVPGVFFTAFAVWGVWFICRSLALERSARKAELANMRRLAEFGEPYPSRPPTGLLPVAAWARVVGAMVSWGLYDLTYGALTLAVDGKTVSFDHVIERGAIFAVLMVIFNLTFLRSQQERQAEKLTVGQRRAS